jgi:hypothetical protein
MVTQGQKIAYLKKSNSDRQKFALKLNIKFLQLTHVSRIKDFLFNVKLSNLHIRCIFICFTKFTYKWKEVLEVDFDFSI